MASMIAKTYFARGVIADRPATPDVPTGCSSLYWATDTINLYIWDGSAWQTLL